MIYESLYLCIYTLPPLTQIFWAWCIKKLFVHPSKIYLKKIFSFSFFGKNVSLSIEILRFSLSSIFSRAYCQSTLQTTISNKMLTLTLAVENTNPRKYYISTQQVVVVKRQWDKENRNRDPKSATFHPREVWWCVARQQHNATIKTISQSLISEAKLLNKPPTVKSNDSIKTR